MRHHQRLSVATWVLIGFVVAMSCPVALAGSSAIAQDSKSAKQAKNSKNAKNARKQTRQWAFTPDPKLPNVLILGDSISIGYTLQVRKTLLGKANVFRPQSADGRRAINCQGTTLGVHEVDHWLAGHKWDVIHFNFGLHDLKHVTAAGTSKNSTNATDPVQATVEQYSQNLEQIVGKLEKTGAKLIFATTTAYPGGVGGPLREPGASAKYNGAALRIMKSHQVEVNDLYEASLPRLKELQLPRNVHFSKAGSQFLAARVSAAIERALAKRD